MKQYHLSIWWLCQLLFLINWNCSAQTTDTVNPLPERTILSSPEPWVGKPQDSILFEEKIKKVTGHTVPERCLSVAQGFLGTPYWAHTLEASAQEQTTINLRGLDCWTFMDVSLAMALLSRDSHPDFYTFVRQIRQFRYQNNQPEGYGSRLHYFSDWLLKMENLGLARDVTQELGGKPLQKKITFITDNPRAYPKMRDSTDRQFILEAQERVSAHTWYYIPKAKVAGIENKIKPGDIIVLTASRANLDVEHQGFAIRGKDGVLRLLHASSTHGRVTISHRPLWQYLTKVPAQSGIMVYRLYD